MSCLLVFVQIRPAHAVFSHYTRFVHPRQSTHYTEYSAHAPPRPSQQKAGYSSYQLLGSVLKPEKCRGFCLKWNGFKERDARKAVAFRGFLTQKPSILDVKTAFRSFKTDSSVASGSLGAKPLNRRRHKTCGWTPPPKNSSLLFWADRV